MRWEHQETATVPGMTVFVYGTLKPGHRNHGYCLEAQTVTARRATLTGFRMLDGRGFPYIIDGDENDVAVGVLITLGGDVERAWSNMNMLEGFEPGASDNHYDLRPVTVVTDDGETHETYAYVASASTGEMLRNRGLRVITEWC